MALQPERPEDLPHLPEPAATGKSQDAGQLHGDRRSARDDAPPPDVDGHGPGQCADVHPGMVIEPSIFDGDERLDDLWVEVRETDPVAPLPLRAPRGAQDQSIPVLEREAGDARRGGEARRQGPGHPQGKADPRSPERRRAEPPDPAPHGFAVTVKTPPSLRPCTAGLYISSACAGGRTNTPGVVARATYVAV